MNTIVQLSAYSFRLDSLRNEWTGCDKTLIKTELFKSLKKGDRIDSISRNKAGFIESFKLVKDEHIYNIESKLMFISPQQRDILKGQCLNISFNSLFSNPEVNFRFEANRKEAIALAHDLYDELKEEYFKW